MDFSLYHSFQLLEKTPKVLSALLSDLGQNWTNANEGANTWSAKEVLAHLIICENTNWMVRTRIILSDDSDKHFVPIDMESHFVLSKKYSIDDLLENFALLRSTNLKELKGLNLSEDDLKKHAHHPVLGRVDLQQLIATWVSHDLSHIAQITRVVAKQNRENVGPFITYLKFLQS